MQPRLPKHPHRWETAIDEAEQRLTRQEQAAYDDLVGDRVPFTPEIPHDEQMAYFLDRLYPNGELDPGYVAQLMETSTKEQRTALQHALDRYIDQRAEGKRGPYQLPEEAPPSRERPEPTEEGY